MARPTMLARIEPPASGAASAVASVQVRLIAVDGPGDGPGYAPGDHATVLGATPLRPDRSGVVRMVGLRPNSGSSSDVIVTPANTVYELITKFRDGRVATEVFTAPDASGEHWVHDHLAVVPGSLAPPISTTNIQHGAQTAHDAIEGRVKKAGDTMTGSLVTALERPLIGPGGSFWPLDTFLDSQFRPSIVFDDGVNAFPQGIWFHAGHVVIGVLDKNGAFGPAGTWYPQTTIGTTLANSLTVPNAIRFNGVGTFATGIANGKGTSLWLDANYTIGAYANNSRAFRWDTTGLHIDPGKQLRVGGVDVSLDGHSHDTYIRRASASEGLHTVASSGSSVAVNWADGNVWDVTVTADCTVSLTGWGADAGSGTLILRGGEAHTVTWPSGLIWLGTSDTSTAPTLADFDIVSFVKSGASIFAAHSGGATP